MPSFISLSRLDRLQEERFAVHDEDQESVGSDSDSDEDVAVDIDQNEAARGLSRIPDEERSTHFLAIRITNPEIVAKAKEIQTDIVKQEEALGDCCMGTGLFHVTLGMLRLEGHEGSQEAIGMVESLKSELAELRSGLSLKIAGLDTFGQRVLYAKVVPEPEEAFWQLVR